MTYAHTVLVINYYNYLAAKAEYTALINENHKTLGLTVLDEDFLGVKMHQLHIFA
jgi:hypothetical protein